MPRSLASESVKIASMTLLGISYSEMHFKNDSLSFTFDNERKLYDIYFDGNWILADDYIALVSEAKKTSMRTNAHLMGQPEQL